MTDTNIETKTQRESLLRELRNRVPAHTLTLGELLAHIADMAAALRRRLGVRNDAVSVALLRRQHSVRIEDMSLPFSGLSFWDPAAHQWVIKLNEEESEPIRRFTLLHEFAHIVWNGNEERLFAGLTEPNRNRLAEMAADMFAAEALMPRKRVEQLFAGGHTHPAELAHRFKVGPNAMRDRLRDLSLVEDDDASSTAVHRPRLHIAPGGQRPAETGPSTVERSAA